MKTPSPKRRFKSRFDARNAARKIPGARVVKETRLIRATMPCFETIYVVYESEAAAAAES